MNVLFRMRDLLLGRIGYPCLRFLLPPIRIWRKVWGLKVCFDLKDCLFYLAMSRSELESLEGPVLDVLKDAEGPVWDVGCNVGLFSLYCASRGCSVTAFDISDKSIELLRRSAEYNKLKIQTVPTALSVKAFDYVAPTSAHTMNSIAAQRRGIAKRSITFDEAAGRFGIPRLIKMDIEGSEIDFFRSEPFKEWVCRNRIALLVEIHSPDIWREVWHDLTGRRIDNRYMLVSFEKTNGGMNAS